MAQDINKFIDKLTGIADDMTKLGNDNTLIDAINSISAISDEAGGFGGEIARVIPSNLNIYSSSLVGIYKSLKAAADNANKGITSLIDYLDSIPVGSLRKKQFGTNDISVSTPDASTTPAPAPAPVVDTTPNTEGGPKSAVLQNESTDTLEDYYKRDFDVNGQMIRESSENSSFKFTDIRDALDESGKTFDFGKLNSVQGRLDRQTLNESFDTPAQGKSLSLADWKSSVPNYAGDIGSNRLSESTDTDVKFGGAHCLDTPENSSDKAFSYSNKTPDAPKNVDVNLDDLDLNIVG